MKTRKVTIEINEGASPLPLPETLETLASAIRSGTILEAAKDLNVNFRYEIESDG